jgi:hypothetical protein
MTRDGETYWKEITFLPSKSKGSDRNGGNGDWTLRQHSWEIFSQIYYCYINKLNDESSDFSHGEFRKTC